MRTPAASLPLGVVIRRLPGVTRWATYSWRAVAVLPGAGPGDWVEMRREGDAVEFHAATRPLELWRGETQAYLDALTPEVPKVWVVLRPSTAGDPDRPLEVLMVTVSPYEAQDFLDSGDELVEPVPMPEGLLAWVQAFVKEHHTYEAFVKRRRDKTSVEMVEDGRGDPRIRQQADVYRAPRKRRQGS